MDENKTENKISQFSSAQDKDILDKLVVEVRSLRESIDRIQHQQDLHDQLTEFERTKQETEKTQMEQRLAKNEDTASTDMKAIRDEMKEMRQDIQDDLDKVAKEEEELKDMINGQLRKILGAVLATIITYLANKFL